MEGAAQADQCFAGLFAKSVASYRILRYPLDTLESLGQLKRTRHRRYDLHGKTAALQNNAVLKGADVVELTGTKVQPWLRHQVA